MRKYTVYPFAFLLALTLVSCRQSPNPSSQNNLEQIAQQPKDKALETGSQNQFAQHAAIGTMMEIESSARMIKHTENRDVQNLATIMVKDHTAAQRELANLAKQQNIALPQTLPSEKQAILAKLDSLKEDERNFFYAKLMVSEHEAAVDLFSKASMAEANTELAKFAAAKLPTLKHHLAEANNVFKMMQKIAGDKGDYPLKISQSPSKH